MSGSSPLTRGKQSGRAHGHRRDRLIPAHAGKTAASQCTRLGIRAHPRSRGENHDGAQEETLTGGSSPLTRGKLEVDERHTHVRRLIPAHAGKTPWRISSLRYAEAHPRSRGENGKIGSRAANLDGSSPLTRGKLGRDDLDGDAPRLIPAHAGKTWSLIFGAESIKAHPRSRGENEDNLRVHSCPSGSSPLTRGKRRPYGEPLGIVRLIPAHAGKTLPDLRFYCADRSDLGNP